MKIAVLKERRDHETRVAATPDSVKRFAKIGASLIVEKDAGASASIPDALFVEAGAQIAPDAKSAVAGADLILKVRRPMTKGEGADETALFSKGQTLVSTLDALWSKDKLEPLAKKGVDLMAMEMMPRITRAQSMDVLSSQSNLAGYRAVIDAAAQFDRAFPMMMTAAGTIAAARVLVLGAGVAGPPAIATARPDSPIGLLAAESGAIRLVPPSDAEALAQATAALLADPAEAARLGAAGRAHVEREAALDRITGRWTSLLGAARAHR